MPSSTPCAGALVNGILPLCSASPESLTPKPVAPDRSSPTRNSCPLRSRRRSVFGTGSCFDEPSAPRRVPPASPEPRVPDADSLCESRVPLFFPKADPRAPLSRAGRFSIGNRQSAINNRQCSSHLPFGSIVNQQPPILTAGGGPARSALSFRARLRAAGTLLFRARLLVVPSLYRIVRY